MPVVAVAVVTLAIELALSTLALELVVRALLALELRGSFLFPRELDHARRLERVLLQQLASGVVRWRPLREHHGVPISIVIA